MTVIYTRPICQGLFRRIAHAFCSSRVIKACATEVRQIDVWFSPASTQKASTNTLGLLGKIATTACIFEPFRNHVTTGERADQMNLDLGNDVLLELVKIPAGSFLMGGDHQITLKSFYLGKYPVTQKQYQQVMGENPSYFKGDNNPVERISWDDAVKFCEKVSQITKKEVRLPSETQWEYAARGGTTTDYFFGSDESLLGEYGWYKENTEYETHPVDDKNPNPWGIYDQGNVWEWCGDDWVDDYQQLPKDGSCLKIINNKRKTFCGRLWHYHNFYCRCGNSYRCDPDNMHFNHGFRVVIPCNL